MAPKSAGGGRAVLLALEGALREPRGAEAHLTRAEEALALLRPLEVLGRRKGKGANALPAD